MPDYTIIVALRNVEEDEATALARDLRDEAVSQYGTKGDDLTIGVERIDGPFIKSGVEWDSTD
jgi:hypothetical protein